MERMISMKNGCEAHNGNKNDIITDRNNKTITFLL